MDIKGMAFTAISFFVQKTAYDMFVKKALKLDTYEDFESLDEY